MGWDDRPDDDAWFSVDPRGRREEEPERPSGRRGPSFLSVLLGLVVVAVAVIAWVNRSSEDPTPTARTSPSVTTTSQSSPTSEGPATPESAAPSLSPSVRTTSLGRAPLGPTGPWELLVLQPDALVRIEMATGAVTTSALPAQDGAPLALVPLRGRTLVQAVFGGRSAFVEDDGRVRGLDGEAPAGAAVAASGGDRYWWSPMAGDDTATTVELTNADGTRVRGGALRLPADLWPGSMRSDGDDRLLVDGLDGTYLVDGRQLRRVTTGVVLATSPRGWLVDECDDAHECRLALVDRATGSRRSLGEPLLNAGSGSIDPAGRRAVVQVSGAAGSVVHLVDLATGRRTQVAGISTIGGGASGGFGVTAAWSPDSRWFVVADERVGVVAVEAATGHLTSILGGGGSALAVATRTPGR